MSLDADIAVVGRGMIGAAAARHLRLAGHSVTLIGPAEPDDRSTWTGPFCSHPDEGRITRIAARTDEWAELAARSIARYRELEAASGLHVHTACGLVAALATADEWVERGRRFGSDAQRVDADQVLATTGISLANGLPVLHEGAPAGYINPRRMVTAQTRVSAAMGAEVVDAAVDAIGRVPGGFRISGTWGSRTAGRVLVATGAFGGGLLDGSPVLERRPRTTVTAELIGPGQSAIPSLILDQPPDERLDEIYWVPPVEYRDGIERIKIGGSLREFEPLAEADLTAWFQGDGSAVEAEALTNCLRALLPRLGVVRPIAWPCVVTATPSGHPYIGWVDEGLAIAIGGNGSAAKSSDELGRLASTLFADDGWTDSIPQNVFAPQFA